MGNEDWRRRRAEELFGMGRGPGIPPARDRRVASDDGVLPMAPTAGESEHPPKSEASPSQSAPRASQAELRSSESESRSATPFDQWAASAYRAKSSASAKSILSPPVAAPRASAAVAGPPPARRVAPIWALLAVVALIAAGAIGWLARGNLGRGVVPAASITLPTLPQRAAPATATVASEPQAPKLAEPQAALSAASTVEPVIAEPGSRDTREAAGRAHRAKRAPKAAPVASGEGAKKAAKLKARTAAGDERTRSRDRAVEKRALEQRNAAPVAAPSRRAERPTVDRLAATRAPGLNCRRARNDVAAAICSDAGLAALDRQLTSRFAALDRSADPATVQRIHHGETAFLNARQTCSDRACIAESYRNRLRELDEAGN